MSRKPDGDPFVAQLAKLCRGNPARAKWVVVSSRAARWTLGERLVLEGTSSEWFEGCR